MASINCFILLSLFHMPMLIFAFEQDRDFFFYSCGTYKPNNTYEVNLKTLLFYLTSNATHDNGFFSTVAGWGTADSISGQILCRGDVTPSACQHCVTLAAEETLRYCPNRTEFIIYYDLCMLRYTSKSFQFDGLFSESVSWSINKTEISDQSRFNQTLWVLLRDVATEAANSTLPDKKFATHEMPFTATQKLYGLGQCTPDLTASECSKCFETAFHQLQTFCDEDYRKNHLCYAGSTRARVMLSGCNIRYDTHPFYNASRVSTASDVHPNPSLVPLIPSGNMHI